MTPFVEQLNFFVALGALIVQAGTFLLLAVFFLRQKVPFCGIITRGIGRWGLHIAFLLFSFATAMSLYYSEVLGFTPCGLCWVQRVFVYPQVILFAVALWKKESRIADYSIALSFFGAIVGLYQHYLQMGGPELVPCPAAAAAGDCAKRIIFEFGYITFPLVGFSMLAFAIAIMLFVRQSYKEQERV
ncbi:MAG: disulfide bond formation protein B [Patescibacteria group bacterium]